MPGTLQPPSPSPAGQPTALGPEIHTIDPDGDVVLVLTRYVRFVDEESSVEDGVRDDGTKPIVDNPIPTARLPDLIDDKCGNGCTSEEEVIIRVSSRHLILASPVFRAMLQRKFSESSTLQTTGSVEIPLPDDDPDAFLILLNIVHGRFRKVPMTVELVMLIQIAILVDKYDLLEAVEIFANFWFDNLKSTIPDRYTDDIPSWICITCLFHKPTTFKLVTRLAMREARGEIPLSGLPIPPSVADTINGRRINALHRIVTMLLEHVDDYLEREHCSFECDALMLGSLTKRLRALNVFPDRPTAPYNGLSFEDINYRFQQGMYFPGAQRTSAFYYRHSKCGIRSIEHLLIECDEQLCGLKLEDCCPRAT